MRYLNHRNNAMHRPNRPISRKVKKMSRILIDTRANNTQHALNVLRASVGNAPINANVAPTHTTRNASVGATSNVSVDVNDVRNIALKTIYDDIMRDNPNSTLTTKKMRVKLRVAFRTSHDHCSSWYFSRNEYDVVRSMFDPKYARSIAYIK